MVNYAECGGKVIRVPSRRVGIVAASRTLPLSHANVDREMFRRCNDMRTMEPRLLSAHPIRPHVTLPCHDATPKLIDRQKLFRQILMSIIVVSAIEYVMDVQQQLVDR